MYYNVKSLKLHDEKRVVLRYNQYRGYKPLSPSLGKQIEHNMCHSLKLGSVTREQTTLFKRYIDATQFVSLTRVLIYPDKTIFKLSGLRIYLTTAVSKMAENLGASDRQYNHRVTSQSNDRNGYYAHILEEEIREETSK